MDGKWATFSRWTTFWSGWTFNLNNSSGSRSTFGFTHLEDPRNLTIQERATRIINTNKLSLNHQLAVFTVMGTQEPHVVRLFPNTTCSCPAKSHCYHIVAARMAIGVTEIVTKRPTLNLTQLRRNKRKRADKTSGRKQPRFLDENVTAAQDTNVTPAPPPVETEDDEETTNVPEYNSSDNCCTCSSAEPPPKNGNESKDIHWIQCDDCPRWYHTICVGISARKKKYICDLCK